MVQSNPRSQKLCSVPNCANRIVARDLCRRHYQRWIRHGSPELGARPTELERFWSKVQKTDTCWIWTGTVAGGYGQFATADGSRVTAHRFSWELHNGPIPDGLLACHGCDNTLCVRADHPDHLFLGDTSVNMRDMVAKGRHPKQHASYWAKLTAEQVLEIFHSDAPYAALSRAYGVSNAAIASIKSGRRWSRVTSPESLRA